MFAAIMAGSSQTDSRNITTNPGSRATRSTIFCLCAGYQDDRKVVFKIEKAHLRLRVLFVASEKAVSLAETGRLLETNIP